MLVTLQFGLPNEYGISATNIQNSHSYSHHQKNRFNNMLSNDNNLNTLMTLGFLSIFSPQYLTRFLQ